MFQKGDRIVYGIHGVCCVVDEEEKQVDRKWVRYLVLEPIGQPGARYLIPTHNMVAMGKLQPLLSREELEQLLISDKIKQGQWLSEDSRRKQLYRELMASGERESILCVIYMLYQYKAQRQTEGKKLHICDENFLRDGEKFISSEISAVLQISADEAKQYLRKKLQ